MSAPGRNVKQISVTYQKKVPCPEQGKTETGENSPQHPPTASGIKTAPTVLANQLYQEAKAQLEMSGNIKSSIKDIAIKKLTSLYDIILRLQEEKQQLQTKLERANVQSKKDMLDLRAELEATQTSQMTDLTKSIREANVSTPVGQVLNEVRSIKQILLNDVMDKLTTSTGVSTHTAKGDKTFDQLLSEVRELREVTETTGQMVTSIKEGASSSYAEVLARSSKRGPINTQPNHSLIVSSNAEKDSSDEVLIKVRSALDAKSSGFQIQRVRKVRNQKVVLSCSSKDELNKMAAKLKTQEHLTVEEAKNKDPLVIIKDLLTYNTDEDIIASIKSQNADLWRDLPVQDIKMSVRYRRRARNPHENHVVLQVSPKAWQRLTTAGKVHIDLQYVAVQDQTPLVQCTRCLGFGHGRKLCREPADLCNYCGGPHHRAACPRYVAADTPSCRNCLLAKYHDVGHTVFDSSCPVKKTGMQ